MSGIQCEPNRRRAWREGDAWEERPHSGRAGERRPPRRSDTLIVQFRSSTCVRVQLCVKWDRKSFGHTRASVCVDLQCGKGEKSSFLSISVRTNKMSFQCSQTWSFNFRTPTHFPNWLRLSSSRSQVRSFNGSELFLFCPDPDGISCTYLACATGCLFPFFTCYASQRGASCLPRKIAQCLSGDVFIG